MLLQKRGSLTGMNAVLWLLKFSNSLPKRQMSFNFHLSLIQAPLSFFSVTRSCDIK